MRYQSDIKTLSKCYQPVHYVACNYNWRKSAQFAREVSFSFLSQDKGMAKTLKPSSHLRELGEDKFQFSEGKKKGNVTSKAKSFAFEVPEFPVCHRENVGQTTSHIVRMGKEFSRPQDGVVTSAAASRPVSPPNPRLPVVLTTEDTRPLFKVGVDYNTDFGGRHGHSI